jgi:hypothetical protein
LTRLLKNNSILGGETAEKKKTKGSGKALSDCALNS